MEEKGLPHPFINRNVVETSRFKGETLNIMFIDSKEEMQQAVQKFLMDNKIDPEYTLVSVVVHTLKPDSVGCVQPNKEVKE